MYVTLDAVLYSIVELSNLHPFFGITFLVCKQGNLPVGSAKSFPINTAEQEFLNKYYHPNLGSSYYFQPFRTSGMGRWLVEKYPFSGSQSTRTRGLLAPAFIHKLGTDQWGWAKNYVSVLRQKLDRDKSTSVPAFWLATWLYRHRNWPSRTKPKDLINRLVQEFSLTPAELDNLFSVQVPTNLPANFFSEEPFDDSLLLKAFERAPDALPEEGATLRELHLKNVGPAEKLDFSPAERLSIVTGDNGLGKTFLLECSWWSLTGQWAEKQALPHSRDNDASISFVIAGQSGFPVNTGIEFDWSALRWPVPSDRPTIPGLIVYARVDGSFAVWDPARHYESGPNSTAGLLLFTRDEVLNGLSNKIEGLIRDWVRWQNRKDQSIFQMFCKVLERLSPPDMAPLVPGEPVRIPNDARDIPTLKHNYGVVPFTNESAGVRRIVTIAYLLVWAWNEHREHSGLARKEPQQNMVIMVDEVEAHLHPKWQRVILPALLDVTNLLGTQVKPQMIVATHSPLILASMESTFADTSDKLFHLYLNQNRVALDEVRYFKHGSVDAWLTSDVFELKQARSQEGESALEGARRLLAESSSDKQLIIDTHESLKAVLPSEDPFWARWLHFAQVKGVSL